MVKKYPEKKLKLDIEALGGEIELRELTISYRDKCNDDPSYDTPENCLLEAGLTKEQIGKLGESLLGELTNEIIDFTYPNMRAKLKELMESGEYTPPTEKELEESKKN